MRQKNWFMIGCFVLAIVGGSYLGLAQDRPAAADPTANTRVEIVRERYQKLYMRTLEGPAAPPAGDPTTLRQLLDSKKAEEFYLWSRRWMEAERDLKSDGSGTVNALRDHLDRMKMLETGQLLKDHVKNLNLPPRKDQEVGESMSQLGDFTVSLKFFRLEAESWLSKASVAPLRKGY